MILQNVKIYTMESETGIITDGYILIRDGKIAAVGSMGGLSHDAYPDEQRVDLAGRSVIPGMIDAHCHVGMWEDGIGFEGDDGNEDTDPALPQLRAIDAVNPLDRCFAEALSAGITCVVTGPGSANPIGGQLAALKTYGRRVENMLVKAPLAMKMALGENPKTVYHGKNASPVTRMGTASIIREQLYKASRYARDIERAMRDEDEDEPDYDARHEALLPVIRGELPVHFHAHRADDIHTAMRIASEFSLKFAIVHGTEAHLIADELKTENVPVLCGPALCDRSKPELRNLSFATPGILSAKGLRVAIVTDHPVTPIQYLPLCAALAAREGMDIMEALRAVTINPAVLCGIDDRVGSIAPGKDADLAVFDGEPLNFYSVCTDVFVDGVRVAGKPM